MVDEAKCYSLAFSTDLGEVLELREKTVEYPVTTLLSVLLD